MELYLLFLISVMEGSFIFHPCLPDTENKKQTTVRRHIRPLVEVGPSAPCRHLVLLTVYRRQCASETTNNGEARNKDNVCLLM